GAEHLLRNREDRPCPGAVDAEAIVQAERHRAFEPRTLTASDIEQRRRLEDLHEIGENDRRRAKRAAALVVEELRGINVGQDGTPQTCRTAVRLAASQCTAKRQRDRFVPCDDRSSGKLTTKSDLSAIR